MPAEDIRHPEKQSNSSKGARLNKEKKYSSTHQNTDTSFPNQEIQGEGGKIWEKKKKTICIVLCSFPKSIDNVYISV